MLRRPKPGDTEEDLLRYQEEFLASKSSPAATVTKKRKPQDDKKNTGTTKVQTQKDVVNLKGKLNQMKSCGQFPTNKDVVISYWSIHDLMWHTF